MSPDLLCCARIDVRRRRRISPARAPASLRALGTLEGRVAMMDVILLTLNWMWKTFFWKRRK